MLVNKIQLLFLALAASTQAWTVPDGTPDGLYSVSVDDNGIETHAKLADPEAGISMQNRPLSARARSILKRDITTCGDGVELNHADTDRANTLLDANCGGPNGVFVPGGYDWYQKSGETVAFFCNFGGDNRCDSNSRARSSSVITAVCGWYKPGWTGPNAGYLTYGYDHVNSKFCGRH
ncbi:hypothetical protein OPT61_g7633 [Boeremia exigua]|uniref:Uncharacterized protein n=1 Tax=Boeremia exigua TaxID=749465 RepID=A0ACC2I2R6_9PLEO|nr:hypothetical protein OPT61_g7633 [Boeremia exigua]